MSAPLLAGFATARVTPPVGTVMEGYAGRDSGSPATAIHDDLYVRALFLQQGKSHVAILSYDLLFFTDEQVTALRRVAHEAADLSAEQTFINTTHTHSGPRLTHWAYVDPSPGYFDTVLQATRDALTTASRTPEPVRLAAAAGSTDLPVSRRKVDGDGLAEWLPDPDAPSCDTLPVCAFYREADDSMLALLFSASCHPSTTHAAQISADFPGVACRILNERYATAGAIYLQGCAGDSKPRQVAAPDRWRSGNWDDVEASGQKLAADVVAVIEAGLTDQKPDLRVSLEDMHWPLLAHMDRAAFAAIAKREGDGHQGRWAKAMLHQLDRDGKLPDSAAIGLHALQLGPGVRLIGLEGEAVAEMGDLIQGVFDAGVTFPLGYTDCCKLYLPVDHMLEEHGYEVDSYWEYGYPSAFRPGIDDALVTSLTSLRERHAILNAAG